MFLTHSGTGLIKCGSIVIPFDNTIGKDTALYKLYNTNIHEKIEEGLMDEYQNLQSNSKDIVPENSEQTQVEQPVETYNSWMIY